MHIQWPRSIGEDPYGYSFAIGPVDDIVGGKLGYIYDRVNSYTDSASQAAAPVGVSIDTDNEAPDIQAGDYVILTYDGGTVLPIFFPETTSDTDFYIGDDGALYSDVYLCDAVATPGQTATTTPSNTPTPTETGTPTLTPTPTQTITMTPTRTTTPAIDIYAASAESSLYKLNEHGALLWSYDTGSVRLSSPAWLGGVITVGSTDDNLYAVNSDGSLYWSFAVGGDIYSSPAILDNAYIFSDSSATVWQIDSVGAFGWSYAIDSPATSSPSVTATEILIGGGKTFWNLGSTGSMDWSYYTKTLNIFTAPSQLSDGKWVGVSSDLVHCFTATGWLHWSYSLTGEAVPSAAPHTAGKASFSSPAIDASDNIYVGSAHDGFYSLTSGGDLRWSWTTGEAVQSSPALSGDRAYFGDLDGTLYSVEAP